MNLHLHEGKTSRVNNREFARFELGTSIEFQAFGTAVVLRKNVVETVSS